MNIGMFIEKYPCLYHMAELGTWPSIKRYGLLSTRALLDLFGYSGQDREDIEFKRRPVSVEIYNETYGKAVIRDQAPLNEDALENCLKDDLTPRDWYGILNSKTFFWTTKGKLETLLNARLYRNKSHTILTVSTAALVEDYESEISLSRINSGATFYGGSPRGLYTFVKIEEFPKNILPVELAVEYGIKDAEKYVLRVEERRSGQESKIIFEK